ncbi:MAG: hypothetical protein RLZZ324_964 [Candidatus Parcubacteria bacterium]|jgi:adenylate kinase
MRNVILIGPQGSGKGTQSDLLSLKLHVPHVALGSQLRAEVAKKSALGQQVASVMASGGIVPDEIVNRIIAERLAHLDAANGAILDGFPRTLGQADELENIYRGLNRELTDVVYLRVSDEEAIRRLSGRRVCTDASCDTNYHLQFQPPRVADVCDKCGSPLKQREDDVPEAIMRRLAIYHDDTTPLIELYRGQGLLREVDGEKPIGEVATQILAAMKVQ